MRKSICMSVIAMALAMCMLFSACTGAMDDQTLGTVLDSVLEKMGLSGLSEFGYGRHTIVPFDQMEYTRPDLEALRSMVDRICALTEDVSYAYTVRDSLVECDAEYYTFETMHKLAEIHYYLDMTDPYWEEEYNFCSLAKTDLNLMYDELYIACAQSEMADTLEETYFGEGFLDYYSGDYTGLTDTRYEEMVRRENELLVRYRELQADPKLVFRGEEVSFYEAISDPRLSDSEYTELISLYYEVYNPLLGELYIELIRVRNEIADYLGYESYEAYAYDVIYGRDYQPEDAQRMVADIKTYLAPVSVKMMEDGVWNNLTYGSVNERWMTDNLGAAAEAIGGDTEDVWNFLWDYDLYDITVSTKKAEMSFQCYLEDYEAPFAFIGTYGFSDDILTFAHEFGHCVDAYVNYNDTYSLELAETFSQGMEYLLLCYPGDGLSSSEVEELTEIKLADVVTTYTQQASFDEFERIAYAIPEQALTVELLNELSLKVAKDFGYLESGYEDYYAYSWIDIVHFFEYPFYVISYCVSHDAAFQIYQAELEEPGAGLALYNAILPREYEGFLETLEKQGDMESPFAAGRMESTAELIRAYYE